MKPEVLSIEIYEPESKLTCFIYVEKLGHNLFRTEENEFILHPITEGDIEYEFNKGTEFETRINKEGKHEIIRITQPSPYITTNYTVSQQFTESKLPLLGKEIENIGGYWQVDMGGYVTINLPANSSFDIEKAIKQLIVSPTDNE